jgi:hypothetical protein
MSISDAARAKGIRNSAIARRKRREDLWRFVSGSGRGAADPTPALELPVAWHVPEHAFTGDGLVTENDIAWQHSQAAPEHFEVGEEWIA